MEANCNGSCGDYPDIKLHHMLADSAAMQIITNPNIFDVIVVENTFGDILSDEAAVIGGSLGMLPQPLYHHYLPRVVEDEEVVSQHCMNQYMVQPQI